VRRSTTSAGPNGREEGSSLRTRELAPDGFDFGGEEMNVHERQEAGQRLPEGDKGLVGVAGAGVNGVQRSGHEFWQLVRQASEVLGQLVQVGRCEGTGMGASLERIEVALGRATPTGPQRVVEMGAQKTAAAHSPGTTDGHLAAGFVRVPWHGCYLVRRL